MDRLEELFQGLSAAEAPPPELARRTRRAMAAAVRQQRHAECRAQRTRRNVPVLGLLPDAVLCGPCPIRILAVTIQRAPEVAGCPYSEALLR